MAINYQRMAATAKRLITDNKQGVIEIGRTVVTPGANSWDAPTTATTYEQISAVAKGVSKRFVDGVTVLATDLELVATIDDYSPLPGDIVIVDGKRVTVISQSQIPAAGIICAWRFIVRA